MGLELVPSDNNRKVDMPQDRVKGLKLVSREQISTQSKGLKLVSREQISERNAYLLVDCSGSMHTPRSKILFARSGAAGFAETAFASSYLVGLAVFSDKVYTKLCSELVRDVSLLPFEEIQTNGSTDLATGIKIVRHKLATCKGIKVICVVTDGMPDSRTAALAERDAAVKQGIDFLTMGTDDADEEFLNRIKTIDELKVVKVSVENFQSAITDMANYLPTVVVDKNRKDIRRR
jgi:Mg-chelatase subunit ChlD